MHPNIHHQSNHHQKHGQRNQQKIIQDQNFSNEIFFGLLSTIESIVIHYQGRGHQYQNKMFKTYDRVNYSSKNIQQLRSQLQSQILLFQASRKVFLQENVNVGWQLPKKFDQNQANAFLQNALNTFHQCSDEVSLRLTEDARKLLWDQLEGLYSEKANLKVTYTEEERNGHKKNTFTSGVFASQQMDKRDAEIKDCKNRNELPANMNLQNSPFHQAPNVTGSKIQQSSEKRQNNGPKNESNGLPSNNAHKQVKRDLQNPNQEWSYIAFFNKWQAESADKIKNYKLISIKECRLLRNQSDVMKNKKELISNQLIYLVPVQVNKEKDVERFQEKIIDLTKVK